MTNEKQPLANVDELAELLGVSHGTALVQIKKLPGSRKIGKRWYIPRKVFTALANGEQLPEGKQ